MTSTTRISGLFSLNWLLPIAIVVFATGFFPYKPFIPGSASFEPTPLGDNVPVAPFNKLIFMVVDALRSDFVFGHDSGFSFTQQLIRNGNAMPFTAHATAPTVTMPRVKAITTGSIPSFLDMILNFAESDKSSSLATQDTWLSQMKSRPDSKLIMYGDDTWLKLFPDTFARSDGTSSFFVSDFTEVDNNVTRHVPDELLRDDWNVMIMHYLGMDHIGHKSGSTSVNMLPKQREMDDIVKQIYHGIEANQHLHDTLFVMCGDHGMTDGGNHGGSAPGETSPALVFMSPKLQQHQQSRTYASPTAPLQDLEFYDVVEQSDIAPTLAGLLGFSVPLNNLGVFIPAFLELWQKVDDQVQLLLRNALQMLAIAKATFPHSGYDDPTSIVDCRTPSSTAEELVCGWQAVTAALYAGTRHRGNQAAVLNACTQFCQLAQRSLSSTASNYDLSRLYLGLCLAFAVLLISVLLAWPLLGIGISISGTFYATAAVGYAAMMLASSYVEEEHQYWYWMTSAWLMLQVANSAQKGQKIGLVATVAMLLLFRILRRWNQSGQKYQGSADIGLAVASQPFLLLWPLTLLTLQTVFSDLATITFPNVGLSKSQSRFFAALLSINCLLFKIGFTLQQDPDLLRPIPAYVPWLGSLDPTYLARLQFFLVASASLYTFTNHIRAGTIPLTTANPAGASTFRDTIFPLTTILFITQTRSSSTPIFLLFLSMRWFQQQYHSQNPPTTTTTAVTQLLLARTSFFLLGGTNGISTIDLSNAYNGIGTYNPGLVGLLLVLGNWAGPLFWALAPKSPGITSGWRSWGGGLMRGKQVLDTMATGRVGQRPMTTRKTPEMEERRTMVGGEGSEAAHAATGAASDPPKQLTTLEIWVEECTILTLWMAVEVVGVMLACIIHRQHLFVWTVFSPKFLYMAAWVVCWHLAANVVVAGALAAVG